MQYRGLRVQRQSAHRFISQINAVDITVEYIRADLIERADYLLRREILEIHHAYCQPLAGLGYPTYLLEGFCRLSSYILYL